MLTRKRSAVEKLVSAVVPNTTLAQRRSMLYQGTKVLGGSAIAVVVATGFQTELGQRAIGDA